MLDYRLRAKFIRRFKVLKIQHLVSISCIPRKCPNVRYEKRLRAY
uniref:Uncharacterized protein n=1 Tax=Anguilla anguilla TaxID=7936 RepID=A0A0E9VUM8_ANGAN